MLNVPVVVEWPSFIVQRVAENDAADVSYFTRCMWSRLHLAVHSGAVCYTVRCDVCPVVPFVTLGLAMLFAQWCRLLHWGLL